MKTIEELEDMLEESISNRDYRAGHGSDDKYWEAYDKTERLRALLVDRRTNERIFYKLLEASDDNQPTNQQG